MLNHLPSLLMTLHLKCRAMKMDKTAAKRTIFFRFLGAAAGSPYIVFITRFRRMASRNGYIYIYVYIDIYIMLTLRWYNNTNIYILAVQAKYYV